MTQEQRADWFNLSFCFMVVLVALTGLKFVEFFSVLHGVAYVSLSSLLLATIYLSRRLTD